jgi:hypothetical protein
MNATRVNVDKEKNVECNRPTKRPHLLGKIVTGPEGFNVTLYKFIPSAFTALQANIESIFLQNTGYAGTKDHNRQAGHAENRG